MVENPLTLEVIKSYDDSVWLHILKEGTVFDTDKIKAHKDWLIEQAEKAERYEKALQEIASKPFYTRGLLVYTEAQALKIKET